MCWALGNVQERSQSQIPALMERTTRLVEDSDGQETSQQLQPRGDAMVSEVGTPETGGTAEKRDV